MGRTLTPIGVIRTPFADKDDAPIQGAFRPEAEGVVEGFAEYAEGLADIDGFTHLIPLYEFARAAPSNWYARHFSATTHTGCSRPGTRHGPTASG